MGVENDCHLDHRITSLYSRRLRIATWAYFWRTCFPHDDNRGRNLQVDVGRADMHRLSRGPVLAPGTFMAMTTSLPHPPCRTSKDPFWIMSPSQDALKRHSVNGDA